MSLIKIVKAIIVNYVIVVGKFNKKQKQNVLLGYETIEQKQKEILKMFGNHFLQNQLKKEKKNVI